MLPVLLLVWLQDFKNPFFIAKRVGVKGKPFHMMKVRSMIVNADKNGVVSTSENDTRITPVGSFVRKYKIDELSQLLNVLTGTMSLVGPRPNVKDEVDLYTETEKKLLTVKPGITDVSSIVFSDLNSILKDSSDPNLDYNQLVRPWKSRLGLFYIDHRSMKLDLCLIFLTIIGMFDREYVLRCINKILTRKEADPILVEVCKRDKKLIKYPPPGSSEIVQSR